MPNRQRAGSHPELRDDPRFTNLRDVSWWQMPSQLITNLLEAPRLRNTPVPEGLTRENVPPRRTPPIRQISSDERQARRAIAESRTATPQSRPTSDSSSFPSSPDDLGARRALAASRTADTPSRLPPRQPETTPQIDPYAEFLQDYYGRVSGAYDRQIGAIGGLDSLFREQAGEAQERVGGFFDYAGDTARAGIPVTQDIYDTAQSNVGNIYDDLGSRLAEAPTTIADAAAAAGGSAYRGGVADASAQMTAPFVAAGETSRADAIANLTQHSAAGQNYLNQLASSTGAESAMHQSSIDSALQQQLQLISYRQAELEGAKERALMEISSDIAGSSAERIGNAALAQALGLGDLPGQVDPMDFLRGQQMIQGMAMGPESESPVDPMEAERDELRLLRERRQTEEMFNPNLSRDELLGGLSDRSQDMFSNLLSGVESEFNPADPFTSAPNPRDLGFQMLSALDRMFGLEGGASPAVSEGGLADRHGGGELVGSYHEVQDAIRRLYGL